MSMLTLSFRACAMRRRSTSTFVSEQLRLSPSPALARNAALGLLRACMTGLSALCEQQQEKLMISNTFSIMVLTARNRHIVRSPNNRRSLVLMLHNAFFYVTSLYLWSSIIKSGFRHLNAPKCIV